MLATRGIHCAVVSISEHTLLNVLMLHSWESGANRIETSFGNEDQAAFNLIQHNNLAYASSNDMFRQLKTYTEKEKEREREREEPKKTSRTHNASSSIYRCYLPIQFNCLKFQNLGKLIQIDSWTCTSCSGSSAITPFVI